MSSELLLENALTALRQPNGLKKHREDTENAQYHFGLITDSNVFLEQLIWMGPPEEWQTYTTSATKEGKVYEKIVPEGKSHSLGNIAERIRSEYSSTNPEFDTPEKLLYKLYQDSDWFGRHFSIGMNFDPLLLSPLWVRTLQKNERAAWGEPEWHDRLYIEDGNHRALVYALRILCGDDFIPVPILWCKSWKHILCWAAELEAAKPTPPPTLKKYFERCTVDKYPSRFFDN